MDIPVPMLEATEDGSETRPEGSPAAASKPSVDDRMVYKLVKVHNPVLTLLNTFFEDLCFINEKQNLITK